jgi:myo-inositol catabolism protein IolC
MTPATAPDNRWLPSAADPMFILAMDHRASFAKDLVNIIGTPSPEDVARMRTAKSLIYEGLRQVTVEGSGRLGVLVDEDFGSPVTKAARRDGVVLAMPIEKSGVAVFELEYGDRFAEHVAAFDPDFVKVLVRYNPDDPPEVRDTQLSRLHAVSDWAAGDGRRWLFELLVPPTPDQLAEPGGRDGYDRDIRPGLTATVITQLQAAGVHPSIWKLEGYDTTAGAEQVLAVVAADRDHPASCIVLGRDAPLARVEHWLRIAAANPGYAGFAVGRTIWEEPLRAHLAQQLQADQLVDQVAHTYTDLIHAYVNARGAASTK